MEDIDFVGASWDILQKGDRFLYAQSFLAANVVNIPNFQDPVFELGVAPLRQNVGNILHSGATYMDKFAGLNYFVAGGWSRTDPNDNGMLGTTESENGYHAHVGLRYDIDPIGLKLGAEWNYGSEYWIGMTPGHDDLYASKIAARGNVYEVYGIYDLPMGEAISKYAKTFMRLGYQRYEYNYTGSNDWNFMPMDLDALPEGMDAIENADQVYLTLEATF
jgi:hypothetical protein